MASTESPSLCSIPVVRPSSRPVFLEVTRRNLPRYLDLIRTSLKSATVVGLALHSTVLPESEKWILGECTQAHYVRLTKLAFSCEIYGLGIACAKLILTEDTAKSPVVEIRNFNLVTGTAASSMKSPQTLRYVRELGNDLNYLSLQGISYYRGRDDEPRQSPESKQLRGIFLAIHGVGERPVVLQNGFLELVVGYAALSGLPSVKGEDFLQRIHELFPGKIVDISSISHVKAVGYQSMKGEDTLEYHCSYPVDGFAEEDVLSFTDTIPSSSGPNTYHPAARDAYYNIRTFLQCADGSRSLDNGAIESLVDLLGGRLLPSFAPNPINIQPLAVSRFGSTKRKMEFDTSIPLPTLKKSASEQSVSSIFCSVDG